MVEEPHVFLEKFGYRRYVGLRKSKIRRIIDLIIFEVKTTWNRSTFGKVMLVLVIIINALTIIIASLISVGGEPVSTTSKRNGLNRLVAEFLSIQGNPIEPGVSETVFAINIQIGFLLIALFGIAGSGMFADDKAGKVTEIYLSRMEKRDYLLGKIGAMMVYINIFTMVPLLITSLLSGQAYGINHFEYIDFYLGIIVFSLLSSIVLSLGILSLSILVEKRTYASLAFFLGYGLGGIFGQIIYFLDEGTELLLLVSPDYFLVLLAYISLGDFDLGLRMDDKIKPLNLNDGIGLEYYHILIVFILYLTIFSLILVYSVKKLTPEK